MIWGKHLIPHKLASRFLLVQCNPGDNSAYLFLSQFDSQFKTIKVHPLAVFERGSGWVVI